MLRIMRMTSVLEPVATVVLLQELVQEQNEDPTAVLRGAECTVCMNRPVQVGFVKASCATTCRLTCREAVTLPLDQLLRFQIYKSVA